MSPPLPGSGGASAKPGSRPRLLYLGSAFPPGVSALFPNLQPPGQLLETGFVRSTMPWWDTRSVGTSGIDIERLPRPLPASPGLDNALNLLDKAPEVWHRRRSLWRLQRAYLEWAAAGWRPDVIMVYNMTPIYDAFVRWIKRRPNPPCLVLYLADSTELGLRLPAFKRFRYRFKPFVWPQSKTVRLFDACVGLSRATEAMFGALGLPWLWLPNGCDPERAVRTEGVRGPGLPVLGYFGSPTYYAGVPQLLRCYTSRQRPGTLRINGFGKALTTVKQQYAGHPQITVTGPVSTAEEVLHFGRNCDVLLNPRPNYPGNTNNFPSKVFEYALVGRAVLSTSVSGANDVLGDAAYYFDADDFENSLEKALTKLEGVPREELDRRGQAIQDRVLREFSWARQGERLTNFLQGLLKGTKRA
jgi:glycosyltransferase involved in cell wall biosynthesis